MEVTLELIFAVVTAVVTGILGAVMKNKVLPSKYIPIQNIVIGLIAALIAVYFNLFDSYPLAILVSLGMSLGVGGAYDATKTKRK